MKRLSCMTRLLILIMSVPHFAIAGFSLKRVQSALGGKPFQEKVADCYQLEPQHTKLVVENLTEGNITIKTDWQSDTVALNATIHKAKDVSSNVKIVSDSVDNDFIIRTLADGAACKVRVDFELIVPRKTKLQLSTGKGNITVNDTHGITMATTDSGNITLNNMHKKARATVTQNGSIRCRECVGALYASTSRGNIVLSDVQNSVVAKTDLGKISVHCKELNNKSKLDVSSTWGAIAISLPETCNAAIKAHTDRGTCICDHDVTLRPKTTKLNTHAWSEFKRSVDGTIGNGTIPVHVSSVSSNIRIKASKVS